MKQQYPFPGGRAQTFGGLAVPRGAENLLEAVHKLTKEPNP